MSIPLNRKFTLFNTVFFEGNIIMFGFKDIQSMEEVKTEIEIGNHNDILYAKHINEFTPAEVEGFIPMISEGVYTDYSDIHDRLSTKRVSTAMESFLSAADGIAMAYRIRASYRNPYGHLPAHECHYVLIMKHNGTRE